PLVRMRQPGVRLRLRNHTAGRTARSVASTRAQCALDAPDITAVSVQWNLLVLPSTPEWFAGTIRRPGCRDQLCSGRRDGTSLDVWIRLLRRGGAQAGRSRTLARLGDPDVHHGAGCQPLRLADRRVERGAATIQAPPGPRGPATSGGDRRAGFC